MPHQPLRNPCAMPAVQAPVCVFSADALLGEGARWSVQEQVLYWVDILGRRLHRWSPAQSQSTTWQFDEEISAVTERVNGQGLLLAMRHGLAFWSPQTSTGQPHVHHIIEQDRPFNRCNDGKCDATGRFWISTMDASAQHATGGLYCVHAGDPAQRVESEFVVTNGPTWTLDQRTLLLGDTNAGRVWAYDFDLGSGRLQHRRLWLQFNEGDGYPDGMCTDAAGRIWICHWQGGCVTCHDPVDARELGRIVLPVRQVTSCAFGGADLQTLYITTAQAELSPEELTQQPLAGSLFAVSVAEPGLPAHRFVG